MGKRPLKITLIQHPSLALKIKGFTDQDFDYFRESGIYLGNIYRKIIPAGLPRLASVMERECGAEVDILDLRVAGWNTEETYKVIDWEGYTVEVNRIGVPFSTADEAILQSDWIGLSSLFTSESGIVKDLITHAKKVNPSVKVMVGGPDVKARPLDYLAFGADLVFSGDFNPPEFLASTDSEPKVIGPYLHPFERLTSFAFDKLEHLQMYTDTHDGPVPEGVPFPVGFIHFTRGCPRECDFCESRKTMFEFLSWDHSLEMLEHYRDSGIRTLNFSDDNLLLLAAKKERRDRLIEMLNTMREMNFAWEYPNGLEIGRLSDGNGKLDEELMEALFSHSVDPKTGEISGAYRAYIPVETFDFRETYKKLRSLDVQQTIIKWLAESGIPELDFAVVLPPTATEETFAHTERGYLEMQDVMARGNTKARYSAFHLIPISLFRSMGTKYSVDEFPEGWNFYFPVYDGTNFSARELFERRLRLVKRIDFENFKAMRTGQYSYSLAGAVA